MRQQEVKRRLVIVDDHPVVRSGLAQLVNQSPDLVVCGEAATVDEGFALTATLQPDLVVVDLSLGTGDGLELIKLVKDALPELPVLVFSMHDERFAAERAFRAGARGYLMKQNALSNLFFAVRQLLDGGKYVSEEVRGELPSELLG
jgi:DNA-binding NarL/FixJ family response regulator